MDDTAVSLYACGEAGASVADLCRECAGAGTSCCRTEPAVTHLCFPLSAAERRRLIPYAPEVVADTSAPEGGMAEALPEEAPDSGDAVCTWESNSPDFLKAMRGVFPGRRTDVERILPKGGRHLRLRTRADGACVFLGEGGCRLPRDARPWYCLLFPAWVRGTDVTLFVQESCLVARQACSPRHGLALMGVSAETVRRLFALLLRDWGMNLSSDRAISG